MAGRSKPNDNARRDLRRVSGSGRTLGSTLIRTHTITFLPLARLQLRGIRNYISAQSGPGRAAAYVNTIIAACAQLATFPQRGAKRDDLRPGLRILGFRRRVAIAFTISPDGTVVIV